MPVAPPLSRKHRKPRFVPLRRVGVGPFPFGDVLFVRCLPDNRRRFLTTEPVVDETITRQAAEKSVQRYKPEPPLSNTGVGDLRPATPEERKQEAARSETLLERLKQRAAASRSERLGLSGKCDIVEAVVNAERGGRKTEHAASTNENEGGTARWRTLIPVEYKKGKRRRFDNDDVQVCAQGLCLEEMFGVGVSCGAIFHAESRRRREVPFNAELRALTEQTVGEVRQLLESGLVPRAEYKPACEECSLFEVCLPKATEDPRHVARAADHLFRVQSDS